MIGTRHTDGVAGRRRSASRPCSGVSASWPRSPTSSRARSSGHGALVTPRRRAGHRQEPARLRGRAARRGARHDRRLGPLLGGQRRARLLAVDRGRCASSSRRPRRRRAGRGARARRRASSARSSPSSSARLGPPAAEPVNAGAGDAARFELFDAVAGFLTRRSAVGPAAGPARRPARRRSAVAAAARVRRPAALAARRVLVLATYREHEMARRAEIAQTRGHLARLERRLAAARPAARRPRRLPASPVRSRVPTSCLVTAVLDTTEGNPFFVDELTRLLNAEGQLDAAGPMPLPTGVSDAIRARLAHLDAGDRRLRCAGGGHRPALPAGDPRPRPGRAARGRLPSASARPSSSGCCARSGRFPAEYVFSHVLVRDALYDDLRPDGARRRPPRRRGARSRRSTAPTRSRTSPSWPITSARPHPSGTSPRRSRSATRRPATRR